MEALLEKMQAGIVPHYMIPHTLGSLANTNPLAVVPYLKNILNIMLPLFGALRSDPLKQAFAFCKCVTSTYILRRFLQRYSLPKRPKSDVKSQIFMKFLFFQPLGASRTPCSSTSPTRTKSRTPPSLSTTSTPN